MLIQLTHKNFISSTCIVILVIIRLYENRIFNDPLIAFFESGNFTMKDLPYLDYFNWFLINIWRYSLNTLLCLIAISPYYPSKIINTTALFSLLIGIVLNFLLLYMCQNDLNNGLIFKVRRLLIQPIIGMASCFSIIFHDLKNR